MQVYYWLCRSQTKSMDGQTKIRDFYTEYKPRHCNIRELVAQQYPDEKFLGIVDKISVRVSLALNTRTGALNIESKVMMNEKGS